MRNLFYVLNILIGMFLFSGCDHFLDEAPRGNAIAETVEDYDKMFNASTIMNMSIADSYYAYWKNDELIFTEDCYSTVVQMTSYPTSIKAAIEYQYHIYREDENSLEWEKCYNQIYIFNAIINGIMQAQGDETEKGYLLAEARVSRAYMHFLLAQWFAMPYNEATAEMEWAIPIVKEANTQAKKYDRATVKELYSWITSEMEEACPLLKKREEHRMRCYQATGYALLGKVYFQMGKYEKALEPLRTAYELLQGDPNVYLTDHKVKQASYGYKEMGMFDIMSYIPFVYNDNETLYCKYNPTMRNYYLPYYNMAPTDYLKPEIYQLFDEEDLRRNLISTKNAMGEPLPYPYSGALGAYMNLGCALPEVYLMLAECEARAGLESESRRILEEFRGYRLLSGFEIIPQSVQTKNDLIRFCVEEQTREFVGTGYRYYNVRRLWNDPLFQDWMPITHTVGSQVYTLEETQLKTAYPETVLIWNEEWRK